MGTFLMLHPRESWPHWLKISILFGIRKSHQGDWIFQITSSFMEQLAENESWEIIFDRKALVITDSKTGEKSVCISKAAAHVIVVFEATVDPVAETITILVDKEPKAIEIPAGWLLWGGGNING